MSNSVVMKYTGQLSNFMNLIYEMTFGLNYIVATSSSIGISNATSGYYDHVSRFNSVQTNESDFGFATPSYPVQGKNQVQQKFYFGEKLVLFLR